VFFFVLFEKLRREGKEEIAMCLPRDIIIFWESDRDNGALSRFSPVDEGAKVLHQREEKGQTSKSASTCWDPVLPV
jgi:hypothetical protein